MKISELKAMIEHLSDDTEIKTELDMIVDLAEERISFREPLTTDFHIDSDGNLTLGLVNVIKDN